MPDSDAAPTAAPILRVESLGKRVTLPSGELVILDDIGFDIARGDSVAVVGASGSGKSTLLSQMAGLDVPSRGKVTLAGEPISTLDEDGRARVRGEHVGFVFQSFQLLPSLTALENVMLPLELRGDRDARWSSCVTSTSVVPARAFMSNSNSMMPCPVWLSRLPVGSSASSSEGAVTNARASATRCCSPPDSCRG